MKQYIQIVRKAETLCEQDAYQAGRQLIDPQVPDDQKMQFLFALQQKGEKPSEVLGVRRAFLEERIQFDEPIKNISSLDVCGTGGDGAQTFNISTATAIVLASLIIPVVKYCGGAIGSLVGGSDVVPELGIPLCTQASEINKSLAQFNLSFVSSADFFPKLSNLRHLRRKIKGATIFNLVMPLLNPGCINYRLIGTSSNAHQYVMSEVLYSLGIERAFVVRGVAHDEDEITLTGQTHIVSLPGSCSGRHFDSLKNIQPYQFGLKETNLPDISGGVNAKQNAHVLLKILSGDDRGARYQVVLANVGAALLMMKKVSTLKDGVAMARKAIRSKAPYQLIKQMSHS